MDTGTHIVMGIALGGMATLDPALQDASSHGAILFGTILGSHAPDFDTVLKLKSNAVYLRHHRGITHSIPFVIMWALIISASIYFLVPTLPYLSLLLWVLIAVSLHVFVDIFNAYGTQALRPFSHTWMAKGLISTFDPVIFSSHLIGIILWVFGADPGVTFAFIYVGLILYYLKRYGQKKALDRKIRLSFDQVEGIVTSPTMKQNLWRLAITTNDSFYVARAVNGNIQIVDRFDRRPVPNTKLMATAKQDKNIAAFLSFSPVYRWETTKTDHYTEVRFIDLRYRSKERYPFVAVAQITEDLKIINSYTGWVYSEQKLQDKLLVEDNRYKK